MTKISFNASKMGDCASTASAIAGMLRQASSAVSSAYGALDSRVSSRVSGLSGASSSLDSAASEASRLSFFLNNASSGFSSLESNLLKSISGVVGNKLSKDAINGFISAKLFDDSKRVSTALSKDKSNVFMAPITADYLPKSEAEKYGLGANVYQEIVKLGCTHVLFRNQEKDGNIPESYDKLKDSPRINCSAAVSFYLQSMGCLDKGKFIKHTPKGEGGTTIEDSVEGLENLKNAKAVFCDKKYKDLPNEYKKPGVVYIQDSNACLSAGNNNIWSVNEGAGYDKNIKVYNLYNGGVLTNINQNTYPFSQNIKAVIVPY